LHEAQSEFCLISGDQLAIPYREIKNLLVTFYEVSEVPNGEALAIESSA
jgi:hypothetical protein